MKIQRITTTIKREWLTKIIDGSKKTEFREAKPYWRDKLSKASLPFELRLINGMSSNAPEVTVLIGRVTEKDGCFRLHISEVLGWKNWNKNWKRPSRINDKIPNTTTTRAQS